MARVLSECVLLILFKGNQAQEIIPLACLSLEVMEGPSIFKLKHLYYPYIQNPNMWFVHEISQSHKTGILTISPFGYFVTKPPLTLIPHNKIKPMGQL
jgi:hypothetical protein